MKPVLLALSLFISSQVFAQGFSGGLRTGSGHWIAFNHDGAIVKPTNKIIWEKGLYARYEAKRFACELQAINYNFYVPWLPYDYGSGSSGTRQLSQSSFSKTNEYCLAVQYRISNQGGKLRNYIGLGLAYALSKNSYEYSWENITTHERFADKGNRSSAQSFYVANHYLSYPVNKHLNVHSAISLKIDPMDVQLPFAINFVENSYSRFSINVGCGYTF